MILIFLKNFHARKKDKFENDTNQIDIDNKIKDILFDYRKTPSKFDKYFKIKI